MQTLARCLLPGLALIVCVLCVAAPLVGGAATLVVEADPGTSPVEHGLNEVFLRTTSFALIVAFGAMLVGWIPGLALAQSARRRGQAVALALALIPVCLPAYLVFYTWWQAWPADSALYAWAASRGLVPTLRQATLVAALICWSWPIVAWFAAASAALVPRERGEMLDLDGATAFARLAQRLRTDAPALVAGGAVVFLLTFNNTTSFDLAQVFSYGNELRARTALGAGPRAILTAAAPTIAAAVVCALVVITSIDRCVALPPVVRRPLRSRSAMVIALVLWGIAFAVPITVVARGVIGTDMQSFFRLYGRSVASAFAIAGTVGVVTAIVSVGLAAAWMSPSAGIRRFATIQALGWLIMALLPGPVVGAALEATYNRSWPGFENAASMVAAMVGGFDADPIAFADFMYRRPVILVVGHLSRAGFAAALLARWVASREPRALRDARLMDGPGTARSVLAAAGPRLVAGAGVAAAIAVAISLAEIPVTAMVHPPSSSMPLTVSMLNAMHYQRPETVMAGAATILIAAALAVAGAALVLTAPGRHAAVVTRFVWILCAFAPLVLIGGCDDVSRAEPLQSKLVFGSTGLAPGQLSYPRAIDVDAERGYVYVVDKTAHVQRFDLDGEPQLQWQMPARANGKPTGISVAPDGRVFVADTHYYRIIVFDSEGNELLRFGEHGEGPGQFVYVTDVAFGPEDRLYVAEYGGHDRIQVFSADGTYLFEFGSFGDDPDQFARPQALRFNAEKTELFIADAVHHRIVVTDPDGVILRTFGTPGYGAGELHYPYGLDLLDDGTLLVAEFGNNRVQHFSRDGEPLGLFGTLGAGPGELQYPWSLAAARDRTYVIDSGNNRVQVIRTP